MGEAVGGGVLAALCAASTFTKSAIWYTGFSAGLCWGLVVCAVSCVVGAGVGAPVVGLLVGQFVGNLVGYSVGVLVGARVVSVHWCPKWGSVHPALQ